MFSALSVDMKPFLILITISVIACSSEPDFCEEATAVLNKCGKELEQSPFGTCEPYQEQQAKDVLEVYQSDGCAALTSSKSDSPLCYRLPFLCVEHSAQELLAFTTDGCSMILDGRPGNRTEWQHCCIEHDFAYYAGGPSDDRAAADRALGDCVAEASSAKWLGDLFYLGVRLGGTPAIDTPWRWGYGWAYDPLNGYRRLPQDQAKAAAAEIALYLENPTPPNAFEQRFQRLWDMVTKVPNLAALVMDLNDRIRNL